MRAQSHKGIPVARWKGVRGVGAGRARVPWSKILEAQHAEQAGDFERRRVAQALGLRDTRVVPKNMTVGELLAWQSTQMALAGDPHARTAVLDRTAPKPKRIEINDITRHSRSPLDAQENEPGATEAADFMAALHEEVS